MINIEIILEIASDAGDVILDIYKSNDFDEKLKSNHSPLTKADLASNDLIVSRLKELTPSIPILSEEGANIDWHLRKPWSEYWLIDPLDGTKEFINAGVGGSSPPITTTKVFWIYPFYFCLFHSPFVLRGI